MNAKRDQFYTELKKMFFLAIEKSYFILKIFSEKT